MWQRKQTIYLLLAVIVGLLHLQHGLLFAIQLLASAIALTTVFLYRRRPLQMTLCLTAVLVNLAWYVVLAALIHRGVVAGVLPMTASLPLIAAILCFLARRGVQADERKVREADRLR